MDSRQDSAFASEVRAFVRANVPGEARRRIFDGQAPTRAERMAWHHALFARGWAAPHWPVAWGGADWSPVQAYLFAEILADEGAPELSGFGRNLLAPVLLRHGSEAQKQRFLPRILSGEDQWCQGFSEPGAGSDLASLSTRAVREGEHWVVNGQKMWTTMAHESNWMFALVRTDPAAPKRQMGISMLLIELTTPGISIDPILLLNGERSTNAVFFDNVRVPAENLVGELHQAWAYTRVVLGNERLTIARVGLSKRQLRRLKQVAQTPRSDGTRPIDDPAIHTSIAAAEIELMSLEAMSRRLLGRVQQAGVPGYEANMLKIKGSELQQRLTELLVEVAGPQAMPFGPQADARAGGHGGRLFKNYFDARVVSIYGGSNEIQRNIIARGMLGLAGAGR